MPSFKEHLLQAERNLAFMQRINTSVPDCDDWQVTACFYAGLHLINAHISNAHLQFRKHKDVENAINPFNRLSPCALPEHVFTAYQKLQVLSRRSRYLVNLKDGKLGDNQAYFTNSKHFSKALRHLDTLLIYFSEKYGLHFSKVKIRCADFTSSSEVRFVEKIP